MLSGGSGVRVEGLLWWEGKSLVGFLGLYPFGSSVELTGMVAPPARRRGIAQKLLEAALPICRDREFETVLLVVPRSSIAGRCLALGRGAVLEHSEHARVLVGDPEEGPTDPGTHLRTADPSDAAELARLLEAAFGHPMAGLTNRVALDTERTLLVEVADRPVGTVRLTRQGDEAGVYGLAVDPVWQHRGIGRDVLRRICRLLRAEGARRIGLEVAVDNDRALNLYISVGFTEVTTEDYYDLPLG